MSSRYEPKPKTIYVVSAPASTLCFRMALPHSAPHVAPGLVLPTAKRITHNM